MNLPDINVIWDRAAVFGAIVRCDIKEFGFYKCDSSTKKCSDSNGIDGMQFQRYAFTGLHTFRHAQCTSDVGASKMSER